MKHVFFLKPHHCTFGSFCLEQISSGKTRLSPRDPATPPPALRRRCPDPLPQERSCGRWAAGRFAPVAVCFASRFVVVSFVFLGSVTYWFYVQWYFAGVCCLTFFGFSHFVFVLVEFVWILFVVFAAGIWWVSSPCFLNFLSLCDLLRAWRHLIWLFWFITNSRASFAKGDFWAKTDGFWFLDVELYRVLSMARIPLEAPKTCQRAPQAVEPPRCSMKLL